jgi:Rrf2 family protein
MLRLSKKADYALMALRHLAAHGDGEAVSARELAESYDIPPELLAKVLQRLVRSRLLESHQGIRGGYGLARAASTISVAEVIQAIDGPLTVTACSDTDHSCDQYSKCNIRDPLRAGGDLGGGSGRRSAVDHGDRRRADGSTSQIGTRHWALGTRRTRHAGLH